MDKDAQAFDAHNKESEDNGRVFEKERVEQEAKCKNSGSTGEQDGVDDEEVEEVVPVEDFQLFKRSKGSVSCSVAPGDNGGFSGSVSFVPTLLEPELYPSSLFLT